MTEVVVLPKPYVLTVGSNWAEIIEVGEQGPPGATGPAADYYPGKTLVYGLDGVLNELHLFSDPAKTTLEKRLVLIWSLGVLTGVQTFNPAGTLLRDRTLQYNGLGQLTGVTDG